jgi:hypothetical protein
MVTSSMLLKLRGRERRGNSKTDIGHIRNP